MQGADFTPPGAGSSAPALSARRAAERKASLDRHQGLVDDVLPGHPPTRLEDDTFLLVAADPGAPLEAAAALTHDTVQALFHGPLLHRGDTATVIWVTSDRARYEALLAKRDPKANAGDLAYYRPGTGEIFVCSAAGGLPGLAHEVSHALIGPDFPHAPRWLAEGVASQYELPVFAPPGEIHGRAHFRLETLRQRLASKDAASVRLDAVFALSTSDFEGPEAYVAEALAREALRWLDAQGKLWTFYRGYRDHVLEDATGERAFVAAMGKRPAELSDAWVAWLRSPEAEKP